MGVSRDRGRAGAACLPCSQPPSLSTTSSSSSTSEEHAGGCLCGGVRFTVRGDPTRVGVCHCRYCQLRTGSAFSLHAYFNIEQVTCQALSAGEMQSYRMNSESGNGMEYFRCATCGTTCFWTNGQEAFKGWLGTAGGCYDPPSFWYGAPAREVFTRSAAPFCTIDTPEHHVTYPAYDPQGEDSPRLSGGRGPKPSL